MISLRNLLIFVLSPVQQVWEVNIDVANNLDSGVHLASASAESQPWQDGWHRGIIVGRYSVEDTHTDVYIVHVC